MLSEGDRISMDEQTKAAYRHLLYVAMLRTRKACQLRSRLSINPVAWYRAYREQRYLGMEADWLHNLAFFSRQNFERFDESRFWAEHASLCACFPERHLARYKELFSLYLSGEVLVC